jgi:hypothetical protein
MSWFLSGDYKNPKSLKGVWIRNNPKSNPKVFKAIDDSKLLKYGCTIQRIVIDEYNHKENLLGIYVWTKAIGDILKHKNRYCVIFLWIDNYDEIV